MMSFGYSRFGGCALLGGGYGMMLFPLILIGIIIFVIYKLQDGNKIGYKKESESSIEILNKRFAQGEISEEEYKQKKSIILGR